MDNDKVLVVLFIIGLVIYLYLKYKSVFLFEGLENNEINTLSNDTKNLIFRLQEETIKLKDTLLIDKYKSSYEELLIALYDYHNYYILNMLTKININNGINYENTMKRIEEFKSVLSILNDTMKFVNKTHT